MERSLVRGRARHIIAEIAECHEDEVEDDAPLGWFLRDSMAIAEAIGDLGRMIQVPLRPEEFRGLKRVDDIYQLLEGKLPATAPSP